MCRPSSSLLYVFSFIIARYHLGYSNAFQQQTTTPSFSILRSRNNSIRNTRQSSTITKHYVSTSPSESATKTTRTTSSSTVELKITDFSEHNDNHDSIPVILLHGLLGNKRNFATLGTSLYKQLQTKRRIIAVDLRNHGDNTHDWRDTMSYEEMAQDVLQVMNSLNIPKAVLVGHSMGGKVAMSCALLEPEKIDGLVILDIAPVTYTKQDPHWKAVQDIIHSLSTLSLDTLETKRDVDLALRPMIEDPALRAFVLTNLEMKQQEQESSSTLRPTWKINMNAIQDQMDILAGFDTSSSQSNSSTIEQYPGDAFLIHGGSSKFVRHSYMETIAQYFPNHMLTTIRGAGHWVHAEAPDDTLALLKRFLDR